MKKIVIFGVGLIGGSVALALQKAGNTPLIVGVGRNPTNIKNALKLGVIDETEEDVAIALKDADVALISAPVAQMRSILESIKPHLSRHTIVTDAGSTKGDVLVTAEEILGDQFLQFVGGHPIAGSEKSGASVAKADLFSEKNVVLTPTSANMPETIETIRKLWQACDAEVIEMSAQEHDSIFAAVSHLPHLLAFALVNDLASRDNAAQLFNFAASGFRDFTRVAGSSPEMWRDISLANRTALLSELDAYEKEVSLLKQLLKEEDATGLQALFERASIARNNWEDHKKH